MNRGFQLLSLLALSGCGARTGDLIGFGDGVNGGVADGSVGRMGDASSRDADGGLRNMDGASRGDGAPVPDADAGFSDPCPSAVLVGSPLPMLMNCSTRDGRSRVVGPKGPHVTWTTTSVLIAEAPSLTTLADANGAIYVEGVAGMVGIALPASFVKIDGTTGETAWTTTFMDTPDEITSPFFVASGVLEAFAGIPSGSTLDTYDLGTGASDVVANLGANFNGIGVPAIGADGSFYITYVLTPDAPQPGYLVVSRMKPDGTVTWTTSSLGMPQQLPSGYSGVLTLALGMDDLVLAAVNTPGAEALMAFDPGTGAMLWTTSIPSLAVAPVVAPDGSIAVIAVDAPGNEEGSPYPGTLYMLGPTGSVSAMISLGSAESFSIQAIARDGTVLVEETGVGASSDGLLFAVNAGGVVWTKSQGSYGTALATIDITGSVVVTLSDAIEGRDLATGAKKWSLAAPDAVKPLCGSTLTSSGGIVAVGCSSGAFGASD